MSMYKHSRIIKSRDVDFVSGVGGDRADFIPFDVRKRERSDELDRSREMEKMLQEMEQKVAAAGKQGYEQGFSEGFKAGSEAQKNEVMALMNTVHAVVEQVASFKEKTLKSSEKQILELCFSIAERIIHQEVSMDRGVIVSVLKAAFRNIVERENIKIRLNPDDYRYMLEIKTDFLNGIDGVRNVFFEEDGTLPRGGAILETPSGNVDARISEQLQEIKAGLMNLHDS